MKVLLDTSVLIAQSRPADVEASISVVSLTELHFGALAATDPTERGIRIARLAVVEAAFDPLPVTSEIARIWGRLGAAVRERGGQPRRRQLDLAIAATAIAEQVPLLTHNLSDFRLLSDLVEVREP